MKITTTYISKAIGLVRKYTLPQDKANHAFFGSIVCASTLVLALLINKPIVYAILITLLVSILKELIDKYNKSGTPEIKDITYTMLGGALVYLPWLVTQLFNV